MAPAAASQAPAAAPQAPAGSSGPVPEILVQLTILEGSTWPNVPAPAATPSSGVACRRPSSACSSALPRASSRCSRRSRRTKAHAVAAPCEAAAEAAFAFVRLSDNRHALRLLRPAFSRPPGDLPRERRDRHARAARGVRRGEPVRAIEDGLAAWPSADRPARLAVADRRAGRGLRVPPSCARAGRSPVRLRRRAARPLRARRGSAARANLRVDEDRAEEAGGRFPRRSFARSCTNSCTTSTTSILAVEPEHGVVNAGFVGLVLDGLEELPRRALGRTAFVLAASATVLSGPSDSGGVGTPWSLKVWLCIQTPNPRSMSKATRSPARTRTTWRPRRKRSPS